MARSKNKNKNGDMLITMSLKGRARNGTVAPYVGETEMTDLDIRDLDDDSDEMK